MPNTYACKGVSNPNVPIFPPRVCTLVLFIIALQILLWLATLYTNSKSSRLVFQVALNLLALEKLLISDLKFERASLRMLHRGRGLLQKAQHKLHTPIRIYSNSNSTFDPTCALVMYYMLIYILYMC